MSTNTIDAQEPTEAQSSQPRRRSAAKKAEVIALLKRAKGATLAEIRTSPRPHWSSTNNSKGESIAERSMRHLEYRGG
jgi:hypothetical protein